MTSHAPPVTPSTAEVLAQPIDLGPVRLANRLTIAPHTVNFGIVDGIIDDSLLAYFARRAAGIGCTILALAAPHPSGRAEPSQPWLWDDRWIPEVAKVADELRKVGSEPAIQLNHGGRQTNRTMLDGEQPVAPSAIPAASIYREPPRALTTGEIADLVTSYAQAARRAVAAGYRVMNLHFGHGYLVSQFLSPVSNIRDDDYGGTLENRMRFGVEIVEAIRAEVGDDVAVDVRLNGRDFVADGTEIDDAITFAHAVVGAGADSLNVSGGVYGSDPFNLLLPFDGHDFLPLAASIRGAVNVPVTGVGNIRFPDEAAHAIATGCCDLVGVARAVMADPDWARKALGDDGRSVRPCLGTLDGCSERLRHFEPAACQVNPDLGRETRPPNRTKTRRRVLVVGAGPAGAETAVRAADAGHDVVVVDRAAQVGGTLRWAATTPGGEPFGWLAEHHADELERLGVDVRLQTELTTALMEEVSPDHVVVATGGRQEPPVLDGLELGTTLPDEDVLEDPSIVPDRAVVLGAGRRAVAVGLMLSNRGTRVTLVDAAGRGIARDASALMRRSYRREMALRRVEAVDARIIRVTADGVDLDIGRSLLADLVVVSGDPRPDRQATTLVPDGIPFTVIGDAKEARSIMDAMAEAQDTVEQLA